MSGPAYASSGAARADVQDGAYKWYVAIVLCAAHAVSMIDRFVMVLVTEPVRAALDLSDAQLGLLQGTGFAILYCGFAVPLGALADAVNRRNLILVGLTVWTCATAAAAFATSFEMLFLFRIFVGLGEACLIPAGMSLLVAYFPPNTLSRGVSVFGLGVNIGYGLAFLGGGVLLASLQAAGGLSLAGMGPIEPWRGVMLLAALISIPVLIMLAWLREPPRGHVVETGLRPQLQNLRDGVGYLLSNLRSYAPFLVVGSCTSIWGYAVSSWSTSLLVRLHDQLPASAGQLVGVAGLVGGPLGTIAGGVLLDRMKARGTVAPPLVLMGGGAIYGAACAAFVVLAPSLPLATFALCLFMFGSTLVLPALYVGVQLITPDRYRGIAASFNMMVYSMFGLGVGPAAVGTISDLLPGGEEKLGTAVIIVEVAMVAIIVPTALLARRRFQARTDAVARHG